MNWRDIPASDIDWGSNPISKRAGYKVRMMCADMYLSQFSNKFSCSAWHEATLGEIADYGERHWLRCTNIGALGVEVIKWVIDEAAEGRCPLFAEAGKAPDAYVPKSARIAELEAGMQWQPIATAPKDGRHYVLLFVADANNGDGAIATGVIEKSQGTGRELVKASGFGGHWNITHWMPLPKSPEQEPPQ